MLFRSSTTVTTAAATTTSETLPSPKDPPDPNATVPIKEIGRIEIPRMKLDTTMVEGVSLPTLDNGPGHWPGTAMPGHLGNVVIAGHRVSGPKPFYDIDKLQPGDPVTFVVDGGRYVYTVRETKIVKPNAMWILSQHQEKKIGRAHV